MVVGTPLTERQYRQLDALSQSMLKEFYDDRRKFHKKYVLGEIVEDDINQAMRMGNLVDCLRFTPQLFDEKFFMSICLEPPTGLMLSFVRHLSAETQAVTNESGEITDDFYDIAERAHAKSGFKWDLARVLKQFTGTEAENYYKELRATAGTGRIVVTGEDVDTANRIVMALTTGEFTGPILNMVPSEKREIFYQLAIHGFVIEGRPFKGLIDMLEINHEERYIQPFDLKATWAVENFYREYYLKLKAYLQAAVYDLACTHLRNESYPGYEVRPMKFICCDTINYYSPLIYDLTTSDLMDAFKGFVHRGQYYKGLIELVKDLNWHMDNHIWTMSRENYLNRGTILIQSLKQP